MKVETVVIPSIVMKVETVVIPSIAASPIEQAVILEIMYAKTSGETVVIPSIAASPIEQAVILEIMYAKVTDYGCIRPHQQCQFRCDCENLAYLRLCSVSTYTS